MRACCHSDDYGGHVTNEDLLYGEHDDDEGRVTSDDLLREETMVMMMEEEVMRSCNQ